MESALTAGATFVAQGFSSDMKGLTKLIEAGVNHKGFSLINVYSPCVTYNKVNTYDWFKENIVNTDDFADYDPSNRGLAMAKVIETEGMLCGLIYRDQTRQSYESHVPGFRQEPLAEQSIELTKRQFDELVAELR